MGGQVGLDDIYIFLVNKVIFHQQLNIFEGSILLVVCTLRSFRKLEYTTNQWPILEWLETPFFSLIGLIQKCIAKGWELSQFLLEAAQTEDISLQLHDMEDTLNNRHIALVRIP